MMRSVLITGASTGIGEAAVRYLANSGWQVFAGVRKTDDYEALHSLQHVTPLYLDVTNKDQIEQAISLISVKLDGRTLTGLVNNAGIAQMAPLALQPDEEFRSHFEVNVFGLLAVTQAALPLLGTDTNRQGEPGRIVNITSVGGKLAAPFLGAYCATKHAVEGMTDSLRRELLIYGIDAITIGPGSVKTPIWDKAEDTNKEGRFSDSIWAYALKQFEKVMLKGGQNGLPPEDIAKVIETALTASKPKTRYAPVPDKLKNFTLPLLLPKRLVDKIMAKTYGIDVK